MESLNNGHLLLSPPHNNSHMQRETMQVTQPSSIPSSPLTSPGAAGLIKYPSYLLEYKNIYTFL